MKCLTATAIVFLCVVTTSLAHAQLPQGYPAARSNSSGLGSLFGGGNGGGLSNLLQGLSPSRSPGVPAAQQNQSNGSLLGNLQGLQGLIPALGGEQPSNLGTDILSRMNQKSKSVIDRTTNWARQKKQEMGQKMLGNLIPGLKPQHQQAAQTAFDWLKPKNFQQSTQPPLRSAQNYGQQPDVRY